MRHLASSSSLAYLLLIKVSLVALHETSVDDLTRPVSDIDDVRQEVSNARQEHVEIRIGFLVARRRKSTAAARAASVGVKGEEYSRVYSTRPGRLLNHVFNFGIAKINSLYGGELKRRLSSSDVLASSNNHPRSELTRAHTSTPAARSITARPRRPSTSTTPIATTTSITTAAEPTERSVKRELRAHKAPKRVRQSETIGFDHNTTCQREANEQGEERRCSDYNYYADDQQITLDLNGCCERLKRSQQSPDQNNGDVYTINFSPYVAETFGDEGESIRQTIELISREHVHVIVGPQETCQVEPIIASIYDVSMISHYCSQYSSAQNSFGAGSIGAQTMSANQPQPQPQPPPPSPPTRYLQQQNHEASELSIVGYKSRGAGAAHSTFIQTKPPVWKVVKRVVVLVSRLLAAGYPKQLVLLYYREPATADTHAATEKKHEVIDESFHKQKPRPARAANLQPAPQRLSATVNVAPSSEQTNHSTPDGVGATSQRAAATAFGASGDFGDRATDDVTGDQTDDDDRDIDSLLLETIQPGSMLAAASVRPADSASEQFKIIGKLLEIKLATLLAAERQRRPRESPEGGRIIDQHRASGHATRSPSSPQPSSSLTVLNWHTTFHYGYVRNPFRNIIRRHLFRQRQSAWPAPLFNQTTRDGHSARRLDLSRQCDLLRNEGAASRAAADASADNGDKLIGTARAADSGIRSTDSIYIVVGHHYEHLGLMLALDELGLFEGDRPEESYRGAPDTGGQPRAGESARPFEHGDERSLRGRRPSIVVGVDIEPHDERDDSVRFLRGLLMDTGDGGSAASPSNSVDENGSNDSNRNVNHNERQRQRALLDLNSLASMYDNYIAVAPAKPRRSIELLDEMRQFYNATNGAGDNKHQPAGQMDLTAPLNGSGTTFSIYDSNLLALRMLQFARLPIEAYHLYDSLMLIGAYFSECLAARRRPAGVGQRASGDSLVAECASGAQMFQWFANRRYSSANDNNAGDQLDAENKFDSLARAEGSYELLARRLPLSSRHHGGGTSAGSGAAPQAADSWQEDEFDIAPVGQFSQWPTAKSDGVIRLQVEPASVARVWLPLWCDIGGAPQSTKEQCADYQRRRADNGTRAHLSERDGEAGADTRSTRGFDMQTIVALCASSIILVTIVVYRLVLGSPARHHRASAHSCLGLDCSSAAPAGKRDNSQWFSSEDARNFLYIVRELLLMPDTLINEAAPASYCDPVDELPAGGKESAFGSPTNRRTDLLPTPNVNESAVRSGKSAPALAAIEDDDEEEEEDRQSDRVKCGAELWRPPCELEQNNNKRADGIAPLPQDEFEVQERRQMASVAIDLHCYMFPFPSCKFVHWLLALYKLKEMLFKYQSNLSGGFEEARTPAALFRLARGRLMFQLATLFAPIGRNRRPRAEISAGGFGRNGAADDCEAGQLADISRARGRMNGFKMERNVNSFAGQRCAQSVCRSATDDRASPATSDSFFAGHHKHSATLRLLLNKYKSTNERLCELARLRHANVVRLLGVTLLTGGAFLEAARGPNKVAQLIVERTGRGSLRQELEALDERVHLDERAREYFVPELWRALVADLLAGLEYLHERTAIGFHGELNATTCLITAHWRLKLSGFHVAHMRRSFGYYPLNLAQSSACINNKRVLSIKSDTSVYLAPEVLISNCAARAAGRLLSAQEMQVADIYSCAFVIYELLVGKEPWSCLADEPREAARQWERRASGAVHPAARCQQQPSGIPGGGPALANSALLAERVKVDSTFRPPMWRLDKIMSILNQRPRDARLISSRNIRANDLGRQRRIISNTDGRASAALATTSLTCDSGSMTIEEHATQHSSARAAATDDGAALKRLIESCWSHSASSRPRSVRALRAQLAASTTGSLGGCGGGEGGASGEANQALTSGAAQRTRHNLHLSRLYTRLVEASARERKRALAEQRALSDELAVSLLPCTARVFCSSGASQAERNSALNWATTTHRFDRIHLCLFKFFLLSDSPSPATAARQSELLNGVLSQLDELINSYQGHLHLWDSQVDSMLRFMACATADLQATDGDGQKEFGRTRRRPVDGARLLATLAFELIDLANNWQAKFEGRVRVRCALHLGPALGQCLEPGPARENIPAPSLPPSPIRRLARFVLTGAAPQVAHWLDRSGQAQRIQISQEFRARLRELGAETRAGFDLAALLPTILSAADASQGSGALNQQQDYVILRRAGGCVKQHPSAGADVETFWLLNGPRVTPSQRLTLPLIGKQPA